MMELNKGDASKLVVFFKEVLDRNPNAQTIAIGRQVLSTLGLNNVRMRNTTLRSFLDAVGDMLSTSDVCRELGSVLTIAEYDYATLLLIRSQGIVADITAPDFATSTFERITGV